MREREAETDRHTHRQTERLTSIQGDRQIDRQTERETDKWRYREKRERESLFQSHKQALCYGKNVSHYIDLLAN